MSDPVATIETPWGNVVLTEFTGPRHVTGTDPRCIQVGDELMLTRDNARALVCRLQSWLGEAREEENP